MRMDGTVALDMGRAPGASAGAKPSRWPATCV